MLRIQILGADGIDLESEKILIWAANKNTIDEVCIIKKIEVFLKRVEEEKPDMVFIELRQPQVSGLLIAEMIKDMEIETRIVLISDEYSYALDAYEVGVYGYLLSPVNEKQLEKLFDRSLKVQR